VTAGDEGPGEDAADEQGREDVEHGAQTAPDAIGFVIVPKPVK
jgi:hypothetical protein